MKTKHEAEKFLESGLFDDESELRELIEGIKKHPSFDSDGFVHAFKIPSEDRTICKLNFFTRSFDNHLYASLEENFNDIAPMFDNYMVEFFMNEYPLRVSSITKVIEDVKRELEYRKSLEIMLNDHQLTYQGISRSVAFEMGDTCLRFTNVKKLNTKTFKTVMNLRKRGYTNHVDFMGVPFCNGIFDGFKAFYEDKVVSFPFNVEYLSLLPSRIRDHLIGGKWN